MAFIWLVIPMASSTMPALLELAFGTIRFWGGATKMPCPATGTVGGCITGGSGRGRIGGAMAKGNCCVECMAIPNGHALGNGNGGVLTRGESMAGGIATGVWSGMVGGCLGGTATGVWSALVAVCLPCRPTLAWARGVHGFSKLVAAHLR